MGFSVDRESWSHELLKTGVASPLLKDHTLLWGALLKRCEALAVGPVCAVDVHTFGDELARRRSFQ